MATPLANKIQQRIEADGPLTVDAYMTMCLYDPEFGYYTTKDPFAGRGDFITAPELTPLFGHVLGAWVIDTWQKLSSPEVWQLLEIGPGRGTLMKDITTSLNQLAPHCLPGAKVTLLDVSPVLRKIQRQTLGDLSNLTWASDLDDVDFTMPTIVIANELLDAFPVKQFIRATNGRYRERLVSSKDGTFHFTTRDTPSDITVKGSPLIVEQSRAMESFLCALKDKLQSGVALFIDYGAESGEDDTLQALRNHKFEGIFMNPGEADLTTHVRFDKVREVLGHNHTTAVTAMGTFLCHLGLPIYAAKQLEKLDGRDAKAVEMAMHRLIHPDQMGTLFKAVAYRSDPAVTLAGL